jgi:hypothetical protein
MRSFVAILVAAPLLLFVPSAGAKDFGPGDLSVCNAKRCIPIVKRDVLPLIGAFYYSGDAPKRVPTPALGTPYYELRFDNGYATGILATRRLDRFLSYGVHLGRFVRYQWYRVTPRFAQELRRLTVDLRPFRLTRAAIAKSH